jgi:hypothetical protein
MIFCLYYNVPIAKLLPTPAIFYQKKMNNFKEDEKWIHELWNCSIAVLMISLTVVSESELSSTSFNRIITSSRLS